MSSAWLAQVMFAASYAAVGWAGPVVLAAFAAALTFVLLTDVLMHRLARPYALMLVAVAFALTASHLLARPHVLALPLVVAWTAGLLAAAEQRRAPSPWLLAIIALWANLHGGFVFALLLVPAFAFEALWTAPASERGPLALRWIGFGVLAAIACCMTPYGWNAFVAASRILSLGSALSLIVEWRPADFSSFGALEACLLGGIGFALYRGVTLSLPRILILLGLIHMALAQVRSFETLALIAPMLLATPLAQRFTMRPADAMSSSPRRTMLVPGALALVAVLCAAGLQGHFAPPTQLRAAIDVLKQRHITRVFNEYGFGASMIEQGMAPFIDARAELYGAPFVRGHYNATQLADVDELFRRLDDNKLEATLLDPETPAVKLLDRTPGWTRAYANAFAVVHVRAGQR
jgi:hypothetical protein